MKSIRFIIYFMIISISTQWSICTAQNYSNLHFRKIGVDDGLSESSVYAILQDTTGYLWFGTKDGLNRYDGFKFKTYRQNTKDSLSIGNNFIRSLIQLNDSLLLTGTDTGIYLMNLNNENFYPLRKKTKQGEQITTAINSLYQDHDGMIWIGTMTQEVFQYNPNNHTLSKITIENESLNHSAVWTIYGDKENTIWVGTRMGLLRYDKNKKRLTQVDGLFSKMGESDYEVLSILEDNKGNLWLGTWDNGLILYNPKKNEIKSFFGKKDNTYISHIRSLIYYSEQDLFIGSDDGLYLFNTWNNSEQRLDKSSLSSGLSDQNVYSMVKDQEGGLWIGTYFGGINYLNSATTYIETYFPDNEEKGLSGKAVSQFAEDEKGNIWIATEDGGINYFNTTTKQITQPIQTSYHNTHALLLDNKKLYIGTFSRGLDIYDTQTKQIKNLRSDPNNSTTLDDDCIFSIYKSKTQNIYVGTPVGLNKFDPQRNSFTRIEQARGFIYDIIEDNYNNLWLATYGDGVKKYNYKTGKWTHYDHILDKNHPIVGSKLTSIYIDSDNRIIFTSEGKGFFIYDYKTNSFSNISEADGFPNNVVYGALEDDYGKLWFSCNKGLVYANKNEPKHYQLLTKEDGLQSNQFNFKSSLKASDGKLYFGGVNGFSSFYPQNILKFTNNIIPPIEITNIQILDAEESRFLNNKMTLAIKNNQFLELPYHLSSFTLSFISLSFISQTKNKYAYQLEGVDKGWNYVGNTNNVTYVNLPPGEYIFKVIGSNNSNLWNNQGTSLKIKILPPFWLTNWAKFIYILIIVTLLYQLATWSIRKEKKKQKYHIEKIKNEQEALAFQSKIDFFTNIAHEIKTPLSLINAPLEEIMLSNDGNKTTRKNLETIDKNCAHLTLLVDQLLDFRKMSSTQYVANLEPLKIYHFFEEIVNRFQTIAQKKNIKLTLSIPAEYKDLVLTFDEDALTKIVSNLLTNALKFAISSIDVSVQANQDGSFTVNVKDDGRGIPDLDKKLIFDPFYQVQQEDKDRGSGIGLSLVKYLSDILNCNISIQDSKERGSIFSFIIRNLDLQKTEFIKLDELESFTENEPTIALDKDRYRLLIVDDNTEMTDYLKQTLQKDYIVDTAHHANEAYKHLNSDDIYDLIISDIMMPDVDGISLTKNIKENLTFSHIPIILLSAKTENSTKIKGLQSGADVFIEKPFSIIYLKAQISSLLENRNKLIKSFNNSPFASYSTLVSNKQDENFLKRLNEEIETNISDKDFTVESLSDTLFMSRSNLQRKLKSICDVTPGDYLRNYRLRKACTLLLESDMRVNEVAFEVGFSSASYFTKAFIKMYDITPTEFIKNNQNKHG